MRLARYAGFAAVFLFLLGTRTTFAEPMDFTVPDPIDNKCTADLKPGAWIVHGENFNSQCAVDLDQSEGGVIVECESNDAVCCKQKDSNGHYMPVCKWFNQQPATPTVTGTEVTAERTTYFEPNVSLPTLTGSLQINGELLAKYLGAFYVYFIGVIGILAVVMIIYGGYHYIVSLGNPQRMNQGKEIISGALIGLMLALASYLLLNIINPALVDIRGIVPTYIARILQTYETSASSEKTVNMSINITSSGLVEIQSKVMKNGYDDLIRTYADGDMTLAYRALTVLIIESSADPEAMSTITNKKTGEVTHAYGLMQLLPATAKQYGADANKLFDPETNIKAGMAYLKVLTKNPCPDPAGKLAQQNAVVCNYGVICTNTDYQYVFAAYNGGYKANLCSTGCPKQTWWQCEKSSGYAETRMYVKRANFVYNWLKTNKFFG